MCNTSANCCTSMLRKLNFVQLRFFCNEYFVFICMILLHFTIILIPKSQLIKMLLGKILYLNSQFSNIFLSTAAAATATTITT